MRSEVDSLLKEYPHLRDSDEKLVANIWWKKIQNTLMSQFSAEEIKGVKKFLGLFAKGIFPNVKTIIRHRQKAQEEDPSLRGRVYEKRHAIEDIWRKEFRQFGRLQ